MINDDSDLDRRLGALFAAPELDLPVRPGATGIVLTRVAQVRRRRQVARVTGALAVAVLLSLAVLNTSVFAGRDSRPAPAAHPTATASAPGSGYTELLMSGSAVGSLRLGMTLVQAKATGLLDVSSATADTPQPGCTEYDGKHGIVSVTLDRGVLTTIGVYEFIRTAEGRAIGDTYAQLHASYPQSVPAAPGRPASYRVPVPGHPGAWYVFVLDVGADSGHPSHPTQASRILKIGLANSDNRCA